MGTSETVKVDESRDPLPSEARLSDEADLDADFPCAHCGEEFTDMHYMVVESLWVQSGLYSATCCHRRCLESRIGRKLVRADYTDAPINDVILGTVRTFTWTRGEAADVNYFVPDNEPLWWPTDPAAVGLIVRALFTLDEEGAGVHAGDIGVVMFPANHYGDGNGPLIEWRNGGNCNVYPGDVEVVM